MNDLFQFGMRESGWSSIHDQYLFYLGMVQTFVHYSFANHAGSSCYDYSYAHLLQVTFVSWITLRFFGHKARLRRAHKEPQRAQRNEEGASLLNCSGSVVCGLWSLPGISLNLSRISTYGAIQGASGNNVHGYRGLQLH